MAVTVLSVALLYLPVNRFFELEPLPLPYLLVLGAITLAYAMTSEAAKRWFFRREGGWGGGEGAAATLWRAPSYPPGRPLAPPPALT